MGHAKNRGINFRVVGELIVIKGAGDSREITDVGTRIVS